MSTEMGCVATAQATQLVRTVPESSETPAAQTRTVTAASARRPADDAPGRNTRRRRRMRALLPEQRPPFIAPREWVALTLWARERWSLPRIAAEVGLGRWPLTRAIDRALGALERSDGRHPRWGPDEFASLTRRQAHRLRQAGLHSIQAVAAAPDGQLLAINGIGPAVLLRLRQATRATCSRSHQVLSPAPS